MRNVNDLIINHRGRSLSAWARRRRHGWLMERFPNLAEMRVLDLGGEAHTWEQMPARPREVVLLNVPQRSQSQAEELSSAGQDGWLRAMAGDACAPPQELLTDHFDLVYSNSVIEHVGGHQRRQAFADSVGKLGDHYWVQTPDRYFPIEPHWLCPGYQFLPPRAQAAVTRVWPIGSYTTRRNSLQQRLGDALAIELLTASQMRFYFSDAEILRERVAGLSKSLIAIR